MIPVLVAAALTAAAPAPGASPVPKVLAPKAMTVAQFLSLADGLRARRQRREIERDLALLRAEAQAAAAEIRADKALRGRATGTVACRKPAAALTSNDLLAGLRGLPDRQRALPLKDGMLLVAGKGTRCR